MSAAPEHVGQIVYTIFPNTAAQKKYELAETWPEIVQRIKSPTVAAEKVALPLISMGAYGSQRSAKGALRHQGNLRTISGVEGDYDAEQVPMEDAAERIGLAGIKAVLYTSPSHAADAPRWRILAPLSRQYPPIERPRFVARLNGILGGILTGESFTTSQSFYIGKVAGRDYEAIDLDGDYIDLRDEFDQHAIMPAGKTTADGGVADLTTDDDLRAGIRSGRSYHEPLRSLAARMIGRGMAPADVSAVLRGLMEESAEKGSVRWGERMHEIPRLVESAAAKFRDRRAPTPAPEPPADTRSDDDEPLFQTADTLRASAFPVLPPIIEGMLLPGATLVHGPAKKGKSWLLLQMALAVDGGDSFLGRHVSRRDVLYVGAEDTSARFKSRLERMFASGTLKFMNRAAVGAYAKRLQRSLGPDDSITVEMAVEGLWKLAGRPTVTILDTQEVFEMTLGISHGRQGESITRRDYRATSSYDALAQRLGIAIVLVGHWGEIKSIEKATVNPHECLNTTKARLAGVTTSITLGPLPNQAPGEATREMQLSIRSRDLEGGDQFLWVHQDDLTGVYECKGSVRDVLVTEAQGQLFSALIEARKAHGGEHWMTAADLADELDCSPQAVKQMVGRVKKSAKAKGRGVIYQGFELDSKPSKGYRLK